MSWRVALCLQELLTEINKRAPQRNKAADGSIGDAAHSSRSSDHNPDSRRIVHARDFTHDPARGADMNVIYRELVAKKDRRIKYIIWNGQITSGSAGPSPWVARRYSGSNPHRHHLHLSVKSGDTYENDVSPWLTVTAQEEDWLMALTDKEQKELLENTRKILAGAFAKDPKDAKIATGRGDSLLNVAIASRNAATKAAAQTDTPPTPVPDPSDD